MNLRLHGVGSPRCTVKLSKNLGTNHVVAQSTIGSIPLAWKYLKYFSDLKASRMSREIIVFVLTFIHEVSSVVCRAGTSGTGQITQSTILILVSTARTAYQLPRLGCWGVLTHSNAASLAHKA